ncbi:hypothetical protein QR680_016726 [Steinernema hermaphroditum]|uniref:PH domain-containing protein n=1 Tax=Steinernema hermaphroditum TaxID=289476 RepID=A0AA39HC46_9BILA|nr:hypothetical protein QR680_016726 [Steinernema hermaphroditum]
MALITPKRPAGIRPIPLLIDRFTRVTSKSSVEWFRCRLVATEAPFDCTRSSQQALLYSTSVLLYSETMMGLRKSNSIELRSSRTSLSSRCSPQAGTSILTSRTIEEETAENAEAPVQYEGRVHVYQAPVTKMNKNKPSYAVLRKQRVLEIYESEKARFKAKQELENPDSGRKQKAAKQPRIVDLARCFNVSRKQFTKEMGKNLVALMTPDETFFLKSDGDDEHRTQIWFEELRQATKTARALQLGRHVNDKEFFERAFDVHLERNPKLDKKMKNDLDRPKNICVEHPSLEGHWRFCIYPHTALLCKRGIEPPKDESRIPASHVPPFDKEDYIELPRDMVVKKSLIGKFYYIQFSHGFPKYGRCEIFLTADHSDTVYYMDAQWEDILCKHKDRQRKGIQYPLDDYDYETSSERRISNSSRFGIRRNTAASSGRMVPESSRIALSTSRNSSNVAPTSSASSMSARSTLESGWRSYGGSTPESIRKTSVTRPMSFGIGSPLGLSSYLQQLQPRAHSVSEQGAPATPSGVPQKSRKYSQKSEEVYSQEHLTNKVLLDQANKRATRRACLDKCPVVMSFSGEETEDSGGTLLPPGPDDRSPRIHRRESPMVAHVAEEPPETTEAAPRPSFEYSNFAVHANAAVPILNDLNSLGGVGADDYAQYDAADSAQALTGDEKCKWMLQKNPRTLRPDSTSTTNDEEIASLSSCFAHTNTDSSDVDMSDGGGAEPKDQFLAEYTMMEPMDRVSCSSGSNTHLSVPIPFTADLPHEDVHSYTSECSSDSCYGSVQKRAFSFSHRAGVNSSTAGTTGTTSMSSSANHSRQFTDDEQSSPGATVHPRRAQKTQKTVTLPPDYTINHLGIKDQMRTALSPGILAADDDDPRNRSFSLGSRKNFWAQPLRKISSHLKGQKCGSRQNSSFSSIASNGHGDSSGACSMTSSNSALHPPKTTLFGGRRKTASGTSQHADIAEGGSVNSSQASLHSHRTGGSGASSSRSLFRSKRAGSGTDKSDMVEMEFPYEKPSESTLRRVSRHGSESIEDVSSPTRSRTSSFGQGPPHSHSYHHHIGQHRVFETTAQVHADCGEFTQEELLYLQRMRQSAETHTEEDLRKLQAKLQPVESFIRDEDVDDAPTASSPRVDPPKTVVGPTSPGAASFCSSPHLLMPYCSTYTRFGTCCGGGVHFFETIQEAVSGRSSRCDSRSSFFASLPSLAVCASSLADRSNALSPSAVVPSPSIVLSDDSAARLQQRRSSAASSSRPATAVSLLDDSRKSSCSSTASCCRRRSTTSVGALGQRRRSSAFEFYAAHSAARKRTSRDSTASAESASGVSCCSCGATIMTSRPSTVDFSSNQLQVNRPPTPDVFPRNRSKSAVVSASERTPLRTPSIKLDSPL